MNVPQSPETILEIRLQEICDFAGARMTLQHSRMEFAEPRATLLAQSGVTLLNDLVTELFVTSYHPCRHQSGCRIKVGMNHRVHLSRCSYRVSNFAPRVPQWIPQRPDKGLINAPFLVDEHKV